MLSLLIQRLAVNCLGCELTSLCPSPFPCLQSAVVCLPQPGTCLSQSAPHTVIKILSLPLHKRLIFCIVFSCFGSIDTVAIRVFFLRALLSWSGPDSKRRHIFFLFSENVTWPAEKNSAQTQRSDTGAVVWMQVRLKQWEKLLGFLHRNSCSG